MIKFCKERVWDNGDMDDCRRQVYAHGYCGEHLKKRKSEVKKKLRELRSEVKSLKSELQCLERGTS